VSHAEEADPLLACQLHDWPSFPIGPSVNGPLNSERQPPNPLPVKLQVSGVPSLHRTQGPYGLFGGRHAAPERDEERAEAELAVVDDEADRALCRAALDDEERLLAARAEAAEEVRGGGTQAPTQWPGHPALPQSIHGSGSRSHATKDCS
jgi:hypothetical protein